MVLTATNISCFSRIQSLGAFLKKRDHCYWSATLFLDTTMQAILKTMKHNRQLQWYIKS